VDAGAAKFFMPQLGAEADISTGPIKRTKYHLDGNEMSAISLLVLNVKTTL
jgi:hypothetical protein